jgi:hypothetical protein
MKTLGIGRSGSSGSREWSSKREQCTDNAAQNGKPVLSEAAVHAILGITTSVPVVPRALAHSLTITFFPEHEATGRVRAFGERLESSLRGCGTTLIPYSDALVDPAAGKLREGIVVIAPGDLETGNLPVDHVPNLRRATVVSIVDGPCPATSEKDSQDKLDSIVKMLAWNIAQVVIYVDDTVWTVCTMNGALIRCTYETFDRDVFHVLVPKIAAPVVPPHASDFDVREGGVDLREPRYRPYIQDFQESGKLWAATGLILFHTSLESLEFRNRYYRRLAAAYLDHRSGMSYGFLARQLPVTPAPVITMPEATVRFGAGLAGGETITLDDELWVKAHLPGGDVWMQVPEVWVLMTRSGCDKSNIDPQRDLVKLGLSRGRIIFATPHGVSPGIDSKPSYDTLAILSHAVANALVGALQQMTMPSPRFASTLASSGMALAHWHGYLRDARLPDAYVVHGEENPPVSCSTFQAAIFALGGKMDAFVRAASTGREFAGDVHTEPHHGINVTGPTLLWLAGWVLDNLDALRESSGGDGVAGREVA